MYWLKVENKLQHLKQLAVVLTILNILDMIFTYISFQMGSYEMNPLMAYMFTKFGYVGLFLPKILLCTIVLVTIFKFIKEKQYKRMRNTLYIGIVPYLGLVGYHIINICLGAGVI